MQPHELLDDDPYRLQCPNSHSSWEAVNGGFWCSRCSRSDHYEGDGAFDEVVDAQTGDRLDREDVRRLQQELAADQAVEA